MAWFADINHRFGVPHVVDPLKYFPELERIYKQIMDSTAANIRDNLFRDGHEFAYHNYYDHFTDVLKSKLMDVASPTTGRKFRKIAMSATNWVAPAEGQGSIVDWLADQEDLSVALGFLGDGMFPLSATTYLPGNIEYTKFEQFGLLRPANFNPDHDWLNVIFEDHKGDVHNSLCWPLLPPIGGEELYEDYSFKPMQKLFFGDDEQQQDKRQHPNYPTISVSYQERGKTLTLLRKSGRMESGLKTTASLAVRGVALLSGYIIKGDSVFDDITIKDVWKITIKSSAENAGKEYYVYGHEAVKHNEAGYLKHLRDAGVANADWHAQGETNYEWWTALVQDKNDKLFTFWKEYTESGTPLQVKHRTEVALSVAGAIHCPLDSNVLNHPTPALVTGMQHWVNSGTFGQQAEDTWFHALLDNYLFDSIVWTERKSSFELANLISNRQWHIVATGETFSFASNNFPLAAFTWQGVEKAIQQLLQELQQKFYMPPSLFNQSPKADSRAEFLHNLFSLLWNAAMQSPDQDQRLRLKGLVFQLIRKMQAFSIQEGGISEDSFELQENDPWVQWYVTNGNMYVDDFIQDIPKQEANPWYLARLNFMPFPNGVKVANRGEATDGVQDRVFFPIPDLLDDSDQRQNAPPEQDQEVRRIGCQLSR